MFDNIVEQFQNAMKPASELMTLNAKAMEKLAQQQTALFSSAVNDSVSYAKELSTQKDLAGIYNSQKTFMESAQESVVSASKEAYAVVAEAQEKAGDLLKGAFTTEAAAPTKPAAKAAK